MRRTFIVIPMGLLIILSGCIDYSSTVALPPDVIRVGFLDLQQSPDIYVGREVILGGVIVTTTNTEEGALLEIYDTRLDSQNRPVDIDKSPGRFLALYDGFLDNSIYRPGRRVTVIGTVQGERIQPLDKIDYHYPLLKVTKLYLFQEEKVFYYRLYYWDYDYPWYDPFWPGSRYWWP
jgi:outer membrane lipoprotein